MACRPASKAACCAAAPPPEADTMAMRAALEAMADELMVDLDLHDSD